MRRTLTRTSDRGRPAGAPVSELQVTQQGRWQLPRFVATGGKFLYYLVLWFDVMRSASNS
jgi:hypothetical protein